MKYLLFLLLSLALLSSCGSDFGKKVSINNNSDVFYKGNGVTGDDAQRLGDFLLREGYFDTTTNKTVQLTKDTAAWVVRLVVDREKYAEADLTLSSSMRIFEMVMSEQVFDRQRTRLELVDDEMKPIDAVKYTPPVIVDDSTAKNKKN